MKHSAPALLATALLIAPAMPALGQATIALTGGWNWAALGVDDHGHDTNTRRALRGSIGIDVAMPLSTRLGLQLGGSYAGKGASFRDRSFLDYNNALELDYLELRLLARALVYESGAGVKLRFLAGPAMAWQASCKESIRVTFRGETRRNDQNCLAESTSSQDFGVVWGGWMEMWVSDRMGLLLSAHHTWGLRDIDQRSEHVTMKTRTLGMHTGLVFSIG